MNAGDRPFCNARTMGKWVGAAIAPLRREWIQWSVDAYGQPFLLDARDDAFQAPYMGAQGSIDGGFAPARS